MALSFKKLKAFATGPQGKKLLAQAKKYDTPANRAKAKAMFDDVRGKAAPAAKAARTKAGEAAKNVRDRKRSGPNPSGGATAPPA
jgi:hypothetical protein